MTEDEAKKAWCPQSGVGPYRYGLSRTHRDVAGRTLSEGDHSGFCIGSRCMAWRWRKVANPDWKPDTNQMGLYPPRNPHEGIRADMPSKTDGYCGLAGQP